jgi:hypothetical protein
LFLKISLRAPVLPNRRKQIFKVSLRRWRALRDRRQHESQKDSRDKDAHPPILCSRAKFSKWVMGEGAARGEALLSMLPVAWE